MAKKEKVIPTGDNSKAALRAFVERIERLEEEKKALADDIKDVYAEAKGGGFDVKVMRRLISDRKKDADKQRELEELLAVYKAALDG